MEKKKTKNKSAKKFFFFLLKIKLHFLKQELIKSGMKLYSLLRRASKFSFIIKMQLIQRHSLPQTFSPRKINPFPPQISLSQQFIFILL